MTQLAEAFDTHPLVIAAYMDACKIFEEWAAIGANEFPPDPIDAMQVKLMRWQQRNFGSQSDERMALGVIEEMAEGMAASTLKNEPEAYDALGDVMVFGSQLATRNRLAIGAILQLAAEMDQDPDQMIFAHGTLAQVVLKGAQKIRGLDDEKRYRIRLVGALAVCFQFSGCCAQELSKKAEIDFGAVLIHVGSEVSKREFGHDAIPKAG
jgi:hypothetical protein